VGGQGRDGAAPDPDEEGLAINGEAKNATTNRVTPGRGSGAAGRPALATLTLPP
jgi:hypothetical protein